MTTRAAAIAVVSPAPPPAAYGHLLVICIVWGGAYLALPERPDGHLCAADAEHPALGHRPAAGLDQHGHVWHAAAPVEAGFRHLRPVGILMWVGGNGLAALAARHASPSFA